MDVKRHLPATGSARNLIVDQTLALVLEGNALRLHISS